MCMFSIRVKREKLRTAAAGMLAARGGGAREEALLELNKQAQEIWPAFMQDLETATGQSVDTAMKAPLDRCA